MSALGDWVTRIARQVDSYGPGIAIGFPIAFALGGGVFVLQSTPTPAPVLVLAFASTGVGILLGFLFGVPRVNDGADGGKDGPALRVNTNVEQISDWLTKILVGLTLANLGNLPQLFVRLAAYLSSHGLKDATTEATIITTVILYLVDGFLFGYLATRLYLTGAFLVAAPTEVLSRLKPALESVSVDVERKPVLSPQAKSAAEKVAGLDLTSLRGPDQMALWAKAQYGLGNAKAAADGYAAAVSEAPDRPDLRVDGAIALREAGAPRDRVLRELEAAYATRALTPKGRRRAVEGLMYNYLWVPGQFDRVIELGKEYTRDGLPSAFVWVYLAAAWGQKHHVMVGAAPSAQLDELRENALQAARQAVALDPSRAAIIGNMLDGKDGDNDLIDFANDPEFRQVAASQ